MVLSLTGHKAALGTPLRTVSHRLCTTRLAPWLLPQHGQPAARIATPTRQPCTNWPRMLHRQACTIVSATQADDLAATDNTFVVTTPLYYVNAAPHMGSAYPTIAADVLARFHRLSGRPVRFVTGTDEHGEKIALAAAKRGMQPQEHCDDIVASYKHLWKLLGIHYDRFIRTTDAGHAALVTSVLERVWDKGDIYPASYEGWYCVDCEEYKDETELDDDHNCPTHRRPCSMRKEENYFFKLSAYQQQLESLLHDNPAFVQPASRRNEVLGWVKEGIRDFSISRAAVSWGIPISRDPSQTVYVWFDALNGYLSALYEEQDVPSVDSLVTRGWPANVHIIGKDILRFHAVYWPAMLMSAGLPLPEAVFGHGFLTKDGLKMGKSLGNVLEPLPLVETYGADAVRFFFMRETEFGKDGDFSEERFRNIVNASLANDIGNLLNRTLNLLRKNCGDALPLAAADVAQDNPLRAAAADAAPVAATAYAELRFHDALAAAVGVSSQGNRFFDEVAPWTAFKKLGYEECHIQALLWSRDVQWGGLPQGRTLPKPSPVFVRLDGEFVTELAAKKQPAVAT